MIPTASHKKQLNDLLKRSHQILILSPDRPDLDSVSSNLALAKTFVTLGKQVRLLANETLKMSYSWMDWSDQYLSKPDMEIVRRDKPDLVVITDASGRKMFSEILADNEWLLDEIPVLLIDHHASKADYPTTLSIVDAKAAATGELLYYLYQAMNWEITPEIAGFMLAGIIFDTNRFENANVDEAVFGVTTELVRLGGNFYEVNQAIQTAAAMDEIKFKTLAKVRQSVIVEPPVAYAMVPYSDIAQLKAKTSLVKPLVESFRKIKDITVSFVLVERQDGKIILSTRCLPGLDVRKVCEAFGGGGHTVAAGAVLTEFSLAEAAAAVLKEIYKQL